MENSESDNSDECGDKMDVYFEKLDVINKFFILEGYKFLIYVLQVLWIDVLEKIKCFYILKMSEVINLFFEVVVFNDVGLLWRVLKELREIN